MGSRFKDEEAAILRRPAKAQATWHTAGELLKAGQHEHAAQLLQEMQVASERSGDTVLADILAAACRICLACSQCRAEVEWHQRAREEASGRQRELEQQLSAILDLVSRRGPSGTREKLEMSPTVPTAETSSPERGSKEPVERLSLWQRIEALLGREPTARPPEREIPVVPPEAAPPLSSAELPAAPLLPAEHKTATVSSVDKEKKEEPALPSLVVYCLGPFQVYQDDQPVEDWPSSKGKAVFKYLVTHRQRPVAKEVLMELFWPGACPDAARNNLNVAIYGLRQALHEARPSFSHILFQDDCYLLNPDLQILVDCEAFAEHLAAARALERQGEATAAIREYRAAEALYQGEFLEEDRYEDWLVPQRQSLQDGYLGILDRLSRYYFDQEDYAACATVCGKMLAVEPCCEEAHRQLMRCYSRQGQPYLALRQYHLCVETFKEELDVSLTQTTTALYEQIRKGKRI